MEGIAWCAAAMNAAQSRLELAADNLANAHSDRFQRHVAGFSLSRNGLVSHTAANVTPGPLRETGRALDIAIAGDGALHVARLPAPHTTAAIVERSRGGSFTRNADGYVVDEGGRALIGRHGFVRVPDDRVTVGADGTIAKDGRVIDRIATTPRTHLASGRIEMSNVDAIGEMIAILDAHRSFETAQKSLVALDTARQKAIDDAGMVK